MDDGVSGAGMDAEAANYAAAAALHALMQQTDPMAVSQVAHDGVVYNTVAGADMRSTAGLTDGYSGETVWREDLEHLLAGGERATGGGYATAPSWGPPPSSHPGQQSLLDAELRLQLLDAGENEARVRAALDDELDEWTRGVDPSGTNDRAGDLSVLTREETHTVYVDSAFRDTEAFPEPEEYSLEFDEPFRNVVNIGITSAEIPKSDYNINSSNNTLRVYVIDYTYSQTAGSAPVVLGDTITGTEALVSSGDWYVNEVQIDEGNYVVSFGSTIGTAVAKAIATVAVEAGWDAGSVSVADADSYPVTIQIHSAETSKLSFTLANNSFRFALDFRGYRQAGNVLGFRENVYGHFESVSSDNAFDSSATGQSVLVAPNRFDLVGARYLTVHCGEVDAALTGGRASHFVRRDTAIASATQLNEKFGTEPLARIVLSGKASDVVFSNFGPSSSRTRKFHPMTLHKLSLTFRRPDGTVYQFRGVNHSLTMAITTLEPEFNRAALQAGRKSAEGRAAGNDEDGEGDGDRDRDREGGEGDGMDMRFNSRTGRRDKHVLPACETDAMDPENGGFAGGILPAPILDGVEAAVRGLAEWSQSDWR